MTYIIFLIDAAKLSSMKESQMEDSIRKWVKCACYPDGGAKGGQISKNVICLMILLAFLSFAKRKG